LSISCSHDRPDSHSMSINNYRLSYKGHVDVVEQLLVGGASVNAVDNKGWTPLNKAVMRGDAAVVKRLLTGGASCQHD
ncbi:MAG: ankyrin repeat domain-containing protein, partial [Nitrospira sp.]|nr:ankyrin repeat domain-containing protein [Nitrospira sp.]